jgi:predicted outer membrane repeat protein
MSRQLNKARVGLLAICSLLIFALSADQLSGQVMICNVPSDKPNISQALEDESCATINVAAGTFSGNFFIERDVEIQGAGVEGTILHGGGDGTVIEIVSGTVKLTDLTITGGRSSFGAGVFSKPNATLAIEQVAFVENIATVQGGGLDVRGPATLTDVLFQSNEAVQGGGLYTTATASLNRVALIGNTVTAFGGGIFVRGGQLDLTNTTISNNVAVASSALGDGGGIFVKEGTVRLTQVTMNENTARLGGAIFNEAGSIFSKSSIFANSVESENCFNPVNSLGFNLSSDDSCAAFLTQATDQNNIDVMLDHTGPKDNGGETPTIALLADSPAIDNIPSADCTDQDGAVVSLDQRGVGRPQRNACDSGAFEVQG